MAGYLLRGSSCAEADQRRMRPSFRHWMILCCVRGGLDLIGTQMESTGVATVRVLAAQSSTRKSMNSPASTMLTRDQQQGEPKNPSAEKEKVGEALKTEQEQNRLPQAVPGSSRDDLHHGGSGTRNGPSQHSPSASVLQTTKNKMNPDAGAGKGEAGSLGPHSVQQRVEKKNLNLVLPEKPTSSLAKRTESKSRSEFGENVSSAAVPAQENKLVQVRQLPSSTSSFLGKQDNCCGAPEDKGERDRWAARQQMNNAGGGVPAAQESRSVPTSPNARIPPDSINMLDGGGGVAPRKVVPPPPPRTRVASTQGGDDPTARGGGVSTDDPRDAGGPGGNLRGTLPVDDPYVGAGAGPQVPRPRPKVAAKWPARLGVRRRDAARGTGGDPAHSSIGAHHQRSELPDGPGHDTSTLMDQETPAGPGSAEHKTKRDGGGFNIPGVPKIGLPTGLPRLAVSGRKSPAPVPPETGASAHDAMEAPDIVDEKLVLPDEAAFAPRPVDGLPTEEVPETMVQELGHAEAKADGDVGLKDVLLTFQPPRGGGGWASTAYRMARGRQRPTENVVDLVPVEPDRVPRLLPAPLEYPDPKEEEPKTIEGEALLPIHLQHASSPLPKSILDSQLLQSFENRVTSSAAALKLYQITFGGSGRAQGGTGQTVGGLHLEGWIEDDEDLGSDFQGRIVEQKEILNLKLPGDHENQKISGPFMVKIEYAKKGTTGDQEGGLIKSRWFKVVGYDGGVRTDSEAWKVVGRDYKVWKLLRDEAQSRCHSSATPKAVSQDTWEEMSSGYRRYRSDHGKEAVVAHYIITQLAATTSWRHAFLVAAPTVDATQVRLRDDGRGTKTRCSYQGKSEGGVQSPAREFVIDMPLSDIRKDVGGDMVATEDGGHHLDAKIVGQYQLDLASDDGGAQPFVYNLEAAIDDEDFLSEKHVRQEVRVLEVTSRSDPDKKPEQGSATDPFWVKIEMKYTGGRFNSSFRKNTKKNTWFKVVGAFHNNKRGDSQGTFWRFGSPSDDDVQRKAASLVRRTLWTNADQIATRSVQNPKKAKWYNMEFVGLGISHQDKKMHVEADKVKRIASAADGAMAGTGSGSAGEAGHAERPASAPALAGGAGEAMPTQPTKEEAVEKMREGEVDKKYVLAQHGTLTAEDDASSKQATFSYNKAAAQEAGQPQKTKTLPLDFNVPIRDFVATASTSVRMTKLYQIKFSPEIGKQFERVHGLNLEGWIDREDAEIPARILEVKRAREEPSEVPGVGGEMKDHFLVQIEFGRPADGQTHASLFEVVGLFGRPNGKRSPPVGPDPLGSWNDGLHDDDHDLLFKIAEAVAQEEAAQEHKSAPSYINYGFLNDHDGATYLEHEVYYYRVELEAEEKDGKEAVAPRSVLARQGRGGRLQHKKKVLDTPAPQVVPAEDVTFGPRTIGSTSSTPLETTFEYEADIHIGTEEVSLTSVPPSAANGRKLTLGFSHKGQPGVVLDFVPDLPEGPTTIEGEALQFGGPLLPPEGGTVPAAAVKLYRISLADDRDRDLHLEGWIENDEKFKGGVFAGRVVGLREIFVFPDSQKALCGPFLVQIEYYNAETKRDWFKVVGIDGGSNPSWKLGTTTQTEGDWHNMRLDAAKAAAAPENDQWKAMSSGYLYRLSGKQAHGRYLITKPGATTSWRHAFLAGDNFGVERVGTLSAALDGTPGTQFTYDHDKTLQLKWSLDEIRTGLSTGSADAPASATTESSPIGRRCSGGACSQESSSDSTPSQELTVKVVKQYEMVLPENKFIRALHMEGAIDLALEEFKSKGRILEVVREQALYGWPWFWIKIQGSTSLASSLSAKEAWFKVVGISPKGGGGPDQDDWQLKTPTLQEIGDQSGPCSDWAQMLDYVEQTIKDDRSLSVNPRSYRSQWHTLTDLGLYVITDANVNDSAARLPNVKKARDEHDTDVGGALKKGVIADQWEFTYTDRTNRRKKRLFHFQAPLALRTDSSGGQEVTRATMLYQMDLRLTTETLRLDLEGWEDDEDESADVSFQGCIVEYHPGIPNGDTESNQFLIKIKMKNGSSRWFKVSGVSDETKWMAARSSASTEARSKDRSRTRYTIYRGLRGGTSEGALDTREVVAHYGLYFAENDGGKIKMPNKPRVLAKRAVMMDELYNLARTGSLIRTGPGEQWQFTYPYYQAGERQYGRLVFRPPVSDEALDKAPDEAQEKLQDKLQDEAPDKAPLEAEAFERAMASIGGTKKGIGATSATQKVRVAKLYQMHFADEAKGNIRGLNLEGWVDEEDSDDDFNGCVVNSHFEPSKGATDANPGEAAAQLWVQITRECTENASAVSFRWFKVFGVLLQQVGESHAISSLNIQQYMFGAQAQATVNRIDSSPRKCKITRGLRKWSDSKTVVADYRLHVAGNNPGMSNKPVFAKKGTEGRWMDEIYNLARTGSLSLPAKEPGQTTFVYTDEQQRQKKLLLELDDNAVKAARELFPAQATRWGCPTGRCSGSATAPPPEDASSQTVRAAKLYQMDFEKPRSAAPEPETADQSQGDRQAPIAIRGLNLEGWAVEGEAADFWGRIVGVAALPGSQEGQEEAGERFLVQIEYTPHEPSKIPKAFGSSAAMPRAWFEVAGAFSAGDEDARLSGSVEKWDLSSRKEDEAARMRAAMLHVARTPDSSWYKMNTGMRGRHCLSRRAAFDSSKLDPERPVPHYYYRIAKDGKSAAKKNGVFVSRGRQNVAKHASAAAASSSFLSWFTGWRGSSKKRGPDFLQA
ncbi:unnamed protein product [Amoebophrya sp. A120]|nr:unnamed protein product [Amoebophrya sp. A120]|eukprot:GSA120T00009116001.1